ncbi:hypothetical protein MSNKSG1_02233 [Marinobacter santoriniensis NKSG1]|uniref:Uncharacterized protein n=1 Tax=Marinobacter santoriniensis NKSG1 TaxID=1288826 RepID=M7CV10_9GAMM|nr:hypothetical protein MSNKSG1_02233 [Marinobacter santoriniensis NKSG1]
MPYCPVPVIIWQLYLRNDQILFLAYLNLFCRSGGGGTFSGKEKMPERSEFFSRRKGTPTP